MDFSRAKSSYNGVMCGRNMVNTYVENYWTAMQYIHFKNDNLRQSLQDGALDLENTVLETVEEFAEEWRSGDIKGLLGRGNFKSDMLARKVSLLSGARSTMS